MKPLTGLYHIDKLISQTALKRNLNLSANFDVPRAHVSGGL